MKRTFLPFRPMLPSASACFITSGMSISVPKATAAPVLRLRSRKDLRLITLRFDLRCCIDLLLLESLKGHQHGHHAANPEIVGAGGRGADGHRDQRGRRPVVPGVEEVDGRKAVKIQVGRAFPRVKVLEEKVRQCSGIKPLIRRKLPLHQLYNFHRIIAGVARTSTRRLRFSGTGCGRVAGWDALARTRTLSGQRRSPPILPV